MNSGQIHQDWFCCRPYLLYVLGMQNFPMASEIRLFLHQGTINQVMRRFDGHPPDHLIPSSVIAVEREYLDQRSSSMTSQYYYFACDEEAGLWFEIGDERWLVLRSQMRKDSHVKVTCRQHDTAHWFEIYRPHTAPVTKSPDHTSLSRKDQRKGNGRWSGEGSADKVVG
ncbi:hypothetical protein DL95DRAFT_498891 [Leptodontidium sp. 2 PMI_412]|nr:hypothetical protein DL95DRAFT_498891 [Leptodontidium sp. 2 PMI_412]